MSTHMLAWLRGVLWGPGGRHLEDFGVKEISSTAELDEALAASESGPVFLFKHSTACPISAGAYRRVVDFVAEAGDSAPPFYLVKVIESRPVSNEIASRLQVMHQSPQLLLVQGRTTQWNTSHGAIDAAAIRSALGKVKGT